MSQLQQNRQIDKKQKNQTVAFAAAGGIFIAAILLITTIWVSDSAKIRL